MGQIDSLKSPRFSQPTTFARLPHTRDLKEADVAFVGIPWDDATTFRPGARFGPQAVREASRLMRPFNPHFQVKPFEVLEVVDWGDVDTTPGYIDDTYRKIEEAIRFVTGRGTYPLICGGDHSISLPVLRALAKEHGALSLVHFDAHSDCWDTYFGRKYNHGTPFRRAVEEALVVPEKSIHVGLRGPVYDATDYQEVKDMGYHILSCDEVADTGVAEVVRTIRKVAKGPSYVTFDIDAIDPAFAPGTGTPEAGGLTSREAFGLVRGLKGIGSVGFDLVEVAPAYDPAGVTAVLASNLIYEFLSLLAKEETKGHRLG